MNSRFIWNVLIKGLVLFLLFDLAIVWVNPETLGKITLYNHLFTGRQRFPFGENPSQSYNLSLFNMDAMFSSHVIANGPKPTDEYRVIVIGDSSIWGTLLRPEETLTGQMNSSGLSFCGKNLRFYNLGYPTISLTKDLLVLDYAQRYQPDLIIWAITLEAFPLENQLSSPIVSNNADRVIDLIKRYNLPLDQNSLALVKPDFWGSTLIGQRRSLADLMRLQMYGILWTATGIDQTYPQDYQRTQIDFDTNVTYHDMQPPKLDPSKMAFGLLDAALHIVNNAPIIIFNEPMLISTGTNSDLRYNFFYPRWVYDAWRGIMSAQASTNGWEYLDLWNIVPSGEFTNSAIHMTPTGVSLLAEHLEKYLLQQSCP
jgi:hypothetical protein